MREKIFDTKLPAKTSSRSWIGKLIVSMRSESKKHFFGRNFEKNYCFVFYSLNQFRIVICPFMDFRCWNDISKNITKGSTFLIVKFVRKFTLMFRRWSPIWKMIIGTWNQFVRSARKLCTRRTKWKSTQNVSIVWVIDAFFIIFLLFSLASYLLLYFLNCTLSHFWCLHKV